MLSNKDFELLDYVGFKKTVVFEKGGDRQIAAELGWDDTSTVTAIQSRLRGLGLIERVCKNDGKTRGGAYQVSKIVDPDVALQVRNVGLSLQSKQELSPEVRMSVQQLIGVPTEGA